MGDELVKMFGERTEIESKYGEWLVEWQSNSNGVLDDGPIYATVYKYDRRYTHAALPLGSLKEEFHMQMIKSV